MSRGSRPRRESAKRAEEKIEAVYEWENCSENSEQFLKVAEHFEKEFEQEGFLRLRKCEDEGMSHDREGEEWMRSGRGVGEEWMRGMDVQCMATAAQRLQLGNGRW